MTRPRDTAAHSDLYNVHEAATYLGITPKSVYRLIHENKVQVTRHEDRTVTMTKATLDNYLKSKPRTFDVPHRWVADKIGYSVEGVSRMRTKGNRDKLLPQQRTQTIAAAFGWSPEDQINAHFAGTWGDDFETVITKAYAKEATNHG